MVNSMQFLNFLKIEIKNNDVIGYVESDVELEWEYSTQSNIVIVIRSLIKRGWAS